MKYLNINEILPNPFQPRHDFPAEEMTQLAKSIKEYGIVEPLVVRINGYGKFELIAGERRLRAAQMIGMKEVPVILKDYDDRKAAQIALIENLQRSNLNAIEEALAYKSLAENFCMTQEDIAYKIGKSRSYVANFMRLLKLSPTVQKMLSNSTLNMGQAKPLLAIEDNTLQQKAANLIAKKELSARKAEQLVKNLLKDHSILEAITQQIPKQIYLKDAVEQLKQILGTNVNIKQGKKKSRIEIEFYSETDLERLIDLLLKKRQTSSPKITRFNI